MSCGVYTENGGGSGRRSRLSSGIDAARTHSAAAACSGSAAVLGPSVSFSLSRITRNTQQKTIATTRMAATTKATTKAATAMPAQMPGVKTKPSLAEEAEAGEDDGVLLGVTSAIASQ